MEVIGNIVGGIGGLILIIGWLWLIILGFKKSAVWGILIILLNWLGGLIFCIVHKEGWLQLALMTIGAILAGVGVVPIIMNLIQQMSR